MTSRLETGISKSFFYGVESCESFSVPIWEIMHVIIGLASRGIVKGTQEGEFFWLRF